MSAEFSHRLPLAHVPAVGQRLRLEAGPDERAALARRFDLLSLDSLVADLQLTPADEGAVRVTGEMAAELEQACGITLVPIRQSIREPIAWRLLPEGMEPSDGEDDPDDIETEQSVADLGEALSDLLAPDRTARLAQAAWSLASDGVEVTEQIISLTRRLLQGAA